MKNIVNRFELISDKVESDNLKHLEDTIENFYVIEKGVLYLESYYKSIKETLEKNKVELTNHLDNIFTYISGDKEILGKFEVKMFEENYNQIMKLVKISKEVLETIETITSLDLE